MWFSGSVAEAVDKSKREKKLFMVFIEGKDDVSKKMAEMMANLRDDILTVMKREVVSFKVEDGTENCKLFGQIYPILMVPSIYFISNTGVNLEVIPGQVSEQEFMDSLDKVLLVHKTNVIQPSPEVVQPPQVATPTQTTVQPTLEPTVSPSPSEGVKEGTLTGENSQPKLDEKVAKAQQLIEQLKLKKAKEDEEKARRQELERIKSGKEMAKAKARREELEMAELVKEREKEKREAAEARKRILAQIEADRVERRQRNEQFKVNSCSKSDPKPGTSGGTSTSSIKTNVNEARIQFRFPDGSFKNQTFGSDDPLCALRQFVIDTSPYRNFTLSTSYPKRVFTADDLTKSIKDLELTPSAVLLVLPSPSVVSKASSLVSTNIFLQIWPLIITPIYWIWTFITSLFRPPPPPPTPSGFSRSSSSSTPTSTSQEQGDSLERKRALEDEREKRLAKRQRESKLLNRDGNVAHLRDNREDKDNEDGTWNGNSTQQM